MPFYIFSLILCALSPVLFHYLSLRIYQLCSYRIGEFLHSLSTKKASYFSLGVALPLVSFTILSSFSANLSVCFFVTLIQTIAVFLFAKLSAKTQLVFTNRLKRFFGRKRNFVHDFRRSMSDLSAPVSATRAIKRSGVYAVALNFNAP